MKEPKHPFKDNSKHYHEKSSTKKMKNHLKKFWYYLWYDDSFLSWLLTIAVAFIVIKIFLYPILGLVLGTNLPIVAVISESMVHDGSFDDWWQSVAACNNVECNQSDYYANYNITKETFLEFPLKNGFNRGDIIFLIGSKPEKIDIGDIIVFNTQKEDSYPIIHRVINIEKQIVNNNTKIIYTTKGDHNIKSIMATNYLDETNVSEDVLIGKSLFKIPYIGYVKIVFVEIIQFLISPFVA